MTMSTGTPAPTISAPGEGQQQQSAPAQSRAQRQSSNGSQSSGAGGSSTGLNAKRSRRRAKGKSRQQQPSQQTTSNNPAFQQESKKPLQEQLSSSTDSNSFATPNQQQPPQHQDDAAAAAASEESCGKSLRETLVTLGSCSSESVDGDAARREALEYLEEMLTQWSSEIAQQRREQQQSRLPSATRSSSMKAPLECCSNSNGSTTSTSTSNNHVERMGVKVDKASIHDNAPILEDGSATMAARGDGENPSNLFPQQPMSSQPPVLLEERDMARVALITFGSYRLGVHRPESDLDVLALSPPHCSRGDFFSSLVHRLQQDERCSEVHPIPSAYTPVVKFNLQTASTSAAASSCAAKEENVDTAIASSKTILQIDLLFARAANPSKLLAFSRQNPLASTLSVEQRCQRWSEPRVEYMIDDSDLQDQDEAGVRSLNGARVSQILLQMVPSLPLYRTVLRAVKEWAVRQGIYSNVLGFLGGVNWAILVAWVCLDHPEAMQPEELMFHFFRTFATWKWPMPVLITPIQAIPPAGSVPFLPAWNPRTNPRDGLHIMPIITPAYPSMNSSYNVGIPQLRRIQDEMIRACNALMEMQQQRRYNWSVLFQPADFFRRHYHFLQVNIRAPAADFVPWFRLVESRLRLLVMNLETTSLHAWPYCEFFTVEHSEQDIQESCFFVALRFAPGMESINITHLTMDFSHKVNSWEGRKAGMDLSLQHVTQNALPDFVWNSTSAQVGQVMNVQAVSDAAADPVPPEEVQVEQKQLQEGQPRNGANVQPDNKEGKSKRRQLSNHRKGRDNSKGSKSKPGKTNLLDTSMGGNSDNPAHHSDDNQSDVETHSMGSTCCSDRSFDLTVSSTSSVSSVASGASSSNRSVHETSSITNCHRSQQQPTAVVRVSSQPPKRCRTTPMPSKRSNKTTQQQ